MILLSFYPVHQLAAWQFVDAGTIVYMGQNIFMSHTYYRLFEYSPVMAHGGAVGWGISLQVGRLRVSIT